MKFEDVKNIAVLGSGAMGHGIAQRYAMGGYQVKVYDVMEEALKNAEKLIRQNLEVFVEEGWFEAEEIEPTMARISYTTDLEEAVKDAQYVQETVPERPEIKKATYEAIDAILPEDAIIVSNASALNPFELVPERRLPNFSTAHWYAPPHIIPLVEVAKGEQTKDEVVDVIMAVLKKCGKAPVRMEKFVKGYIINRLQILLNTEVYYLLENGICTPEMLDIAVKASFMPRGCVLGLVQRMDFGGLDITCNNLINKSYQIPEVPERPSVLFDHFEKGELGVKTGKGFFDYTGREKSELLKTRDQRLIQVLKATEPFIEQQI